MNNYFQDGKSFAWNKIENEGAEAILEALEINSSLKELDLSIKNGIKSINTFINFPFESNDIEEGLLGRINICLGLKAADDDFSLSDSIIDESYAREIGNKLKQSSSIESVYLRSNIYHFCYFSQYQV